LTDSDSQGPKAVQTTLMTSLSVAGTGLHSGRFRPRTLREAPAGTGVPFAGRTWSGRDPLVPARWDRVELSPLNTRIVNEAGVSVSTIEHLMAALAGCGVRNALVDIDGPEVPILDGSAEPWVRAIRARGCAGWRRR
jgi:UDP-3-O-[3-hydroxymyristoyl] N-acetylglucosamine deacetylase